MPHDDQLYSPLASPQDIALWDAASAADYAVPTLLLMENAAREALNAFRRYRVPGPCLNVAVLAGGGNNGGDGISLARHLHNLGCRVRLLTLPAPGTYRGISRSHLRMAAKAGVKAERLRLRNGLPCLPGRWNTEPDGTLPDVIIDALLGAGFKAPLREGAASLIRQINELRERGVFVFSLDIPSGLDAMSGRPAPEAVRANATVTFAAAKPGLVMPWAAQYTGELSVCEIGIPAALMCQSPGAYRLINPKAGVIRPHSPLAHKTRKGRVLVIGGSPGLTGAPALSALGAARCGAGLVSVAAPCGLTGEIKSGHPEIMTLPLGLPESGTVPDVWPPRHNDANTKNNAAQGTGASSCMTAKGTNASSDTAATAATSTQAGFGDVNWRAEHLPELLRFISGLDERSAIVIGPGIGRAPYVAELLEAVVSLPKRPPLVLDADGLFPFSVNPRTGGEKSARRLPLSLLREDDILTPHPGEMLRLLDEDLPEDLKPRFGNLMELEPRTEALQLLCANCRATLLLKGPATLVGKSGCPVGIAPFAESNLGVGGSGDVLAGIIAALLARGLAPLKAASLGAHLHGRAGVLTRRKYPAGGNLASDIADCVPGAMRELYECL